MDAQVDLPPHQVEAALFAFRSPLSNGAILADEVGLEKIEAGLLIAQKWAERKRRILIIVPSNLRKQWKYLFLADQVRSSDIGISIQEKEWKKLKRGLDSMSSGIGLSWSLTR
ncbi:MAG: hypothetical protein M0P58_09070 [Bacteroidales bacterium]|nr:hypothetical protein [Bacteroidales bacterium]